MTTITYIFSKKRFVGEKYSLFVDSLYNEGSPTLKLLLQNAPSGYFCIGGIRARLSEGSCEMNLSSLLDGEYVPKLITSGATYLCEPIVISDKGIYKAPLYKTEAQDIKSAIAQLSQRLADAEEKLCELSLKIEKKETLKF